MFEIMIAAAAAAQPAPRIVAVPSPPPFVALRIPSAQYRDDWRRQPEPLQLRVSAGGREMWRGTLHVSQAVGANYSEQLSEASPVPCAPESSSRESHQLRISVNKYGSGEGNDRYNFDVHWERPAADPSACNGVRGVRLQQQIPLAPGQSVTLQGDAGLTVQIRRP